MIRYSLPKDIDRAASPIHDRLHREYDGKLQVSFGGSALLAHSYDPVGIQALWSLIGAVASLGESFTFRVRLGMTCHGFLGGFADGQFCLFKSGNNSLEIWTRSKIEPIGSRKVVLEDQSYDSDFWIPSAAMISFEEMVAVGNAFLVSSNDYVRTRVYEYYDNWDGDVYRDSPEQPAD